MCSFMPEATQTGVISWHKLSSLAAMDDYPGVMGY